MQYYSTNLIAPRVSFKSALLKGLAEDKGLYMPESIPTFTSEELLAMQQMEYPELAYSVASKFLIADIPAADLRRLVFDAYNYPIPLEQVSGKKYVMRLDQGPTASFKDFAARLMGRWMQYFLNQDKQKLLILTATSGDTGSAIANAFFGLDNIQVVVLFPLAEVTDRQRKQMTTLGQNVKIIAIDGKFDDCQALVKQAFSDPELDYLQLSSANSINIGRLLPQTMYYFYAYSRLCNQVEQDTDPAETVSKASESSLAGSASCSTGGASCSTDLEKIIFSVPSGNFGDLMGGLIAMRMGLPVQKFVVATNANDEFPRFLDSGKYQTIAPSRNCISSAMNVGHPSNVARLIALYGGVMDETGKIHTMPDLAKLKQDMYSVSISDLETEQTIKQVMQQHQALLEPHGSVGWAGLQYYLKAHPEDADRVCVALETAHPAKFPEKIIDLLGIDPALPPSLQNLEDKPEAYDHLANDYLEFAKYLKGNYDRG